MKNLLSTLVIAISSLYFGNAKANTVLIDGSNFEAGEWTGKAFRNPQSGEWAECYVYRKFRNGFYLGFSVNSSGFIIFLTHRDKPFFTGVDIFPVVSQVDRYDPMFVKAEIHRDDQREISLFYQDGHKIVRQLQAGRELKVSSKFGILNFSLKGTSKALSKAWECVGKYQDENALIGSIGETLGNSSAATFGAIAISTDDGAYGFGYGYENRPDAESRALRECREFGSNCTIALSLRDACGALALANNSWGAQWGNSNIEAERKAIKTCRSYNGKNCQIKVSICSYD